MVLVLGRDEGYIIKAIDSLPKILMFFYPLSLQAKVVDLRYLKQWFILDQII